MSAWRVPRPHLQRVGVDGRTRATWGDCRPGCSRATSDSSEGGIG